MQVRCSSAEHSTARPHRAAAGRRSQLRREYQEGSGRGQGLELAGTQCDAPTSRAGARRGVRDNPCPSANPRQWNPWSTDADGSHPLACPPTSRPSRLRLQRERLWRARGRNHAGWVCSCAARSMRFGSKRRLGKGAAPAPLHPRANCTVAVAAARGLPLASEEETED